jgi:hypothetical protein
MLEHFRMRAGDSSEKAEGGEVLLDERALSAPPDAG